MEFNYEPCPSKNHDGSHDNRTDNSIDEDASLEFDWDREKIEQQLTEVGFSKELQRQVVGSLSGGWKMRLELARAMLYDADLLLLDEPTNHVCTNNFLSFLTYPLRSLASSGFSLI